ncbi:hypothetical protein [Mycolicibacterium goodii]|uniref:DUF7159 domain-containing protein n=1 Tax=Mycolicibacterium goodii TaxID=134601 RepID=A0A0K0X9J8_MYCGD|nr:hypothetical protein AFA91_21425 [Mycolicibacterium goodii]
MKTVLGLSATSGGVGWVLIDQRDGRDASDVAVLDDDAFEIDGDDQLAERCAAAARGARGIAASSGDEIGAIGLVCSDDVDAQADPIVAALRAAGFDDVRTVPRDLLVASGDDESDTDGPLEATALAAARAVATDAVPAAARVRCLLPPCRHRSTTLRIAGTAAAAAVVALSTVGSSFIAGPTGPAEDPAPAAAGPVQIVTAARPHAPQPATVRMVSKPKRQSTTRATVTAPAAQVLFARPRPEPVTQQTVPQYTPESASDLGVQHLQNPVIAPEFAPPIPHLPEGVPAGAGPAPGALPLPGPVAPQVITPQASQILPGPVPQPAPQADAQVPAPAMAPRPVSLNPLVSGLP